MYRLTAGICALVMIVAWPVSAQPAASAPVRSATPRAAAAAAPARPSAPPRVTPAILPGTPAGAFTTIQGNALDSSNHVLVDSPMRLRDARFGRIVDSQFTDKSGLFTFRAVDPGSYVVELLNAQNTTVLAASEILNVNAGETATTIVKLPSRVPPIGGLFTRNAAQAAVITAAAAATGVLTKAATTAVSCEQLPCNR